ncbi:MAG TPA: HAMP domain-containing sensor histidine kinase [Steroidobacteraceae bacterium]|nr:HAMP domain-containing sensor histidine kinase [Steroidobacteraceae bacterium]
MQWVRPKSLSGLMLFGLLLLALPLLVAIITAALQIRTLATKGQQIVIEGVTSARASQQLFSQIASLERTARLYDVLSDPKLLDTYKEQDETFSATRAKLYEDATAATRQTLREVAAVQHAIRTAVLTTPATAAAANPTGLTQQFSRLSGLVDKVAEQSNEQIDAEVASLQVRTDRARERLFWQAALLLPLTLIAIITLTLIVGRPLRHLDRAINEIGHGNISNPITVRGPHDLVRLGKQLEWLRLRLLELAQERNRFLRHMSHELKTPLANIREGTELLMDGAVGELDTAQREVTAILRDNGIKLQRMIENLLSFSAWQTSSVGLEATEFRLRPVVKQVLENQQLTLLSQRVRLDVQVEDVTLVADRSKIRLILENLVSNAVKYSPKGGTIHIKAATSANSIVIDVADNGPGIAKEERDHVFEAFYTGRAAKTTAVKGTGIGLSVVLEFVAAHGGTVQIVDGEYPGAHFRISMPITRARGGRPGDSPERRTQAHAA